ncbi:MAG: GntR family transcriptional regulator [Omnitrophica WOR_2 bacterium]
MNILAGKIRVDFRANEPIYLQIAGQIEQLVAQGELKLGDQLPTVRELATELRINFNTVTRAYNVLDQARLISTQRGRGTYIWEKPSQETVQMLRHERLNQLCWQCIEEASRMGFTTDEITRAFSEQIQAWNKDNPANQASFTEHERSE